MACGLDVEAKSGRAVLSHGCKKCAAACRRRVYVRFCGCVIFGRCSAFTELFAEVL